MTNQPFPRLFQTTIAGVGPFCVEFEDGEIICTRSETRQKAIALIEPVKDERHPSHRTRVSMDASSFDEICVLCGATDVAGGGWGNLRFKCTGKMPG